MLIEAPVHAADPLLLAAGAALLGLIVGSFLNVVIHRLPRMLEAEWQAQCEELAGRDPAPRPAYNLLVPRSHCPACRTPIRLPHLLPLIGWLLARGRCAACGVAIPTRYPLVEGLTALLFALAALQFGAGWTLAAAMFVIAVLVALTFIDFDTQLLPDQLTIPLMWAGLAASLPAGRAPEALIGAIAGYLSLWSVYWAFKLATGKEGMGYGDFKLLAALGAWLGWQALVPIVLIASVAGAVAGLALMARGNGRDTPIAFGPWLAIAGWAVMMWGDALLPAVTRLLTGG
jgi:leader peptidase (prepilin peptidase)/N-methyltransferase